MLPASLYNMPKRLTFDETYLTPLQSTTTHRNDPVCVFEADEIFHDGASILQLTDCSCVLGYSFFVVLAIICKLTYIEVSTKICYVMFWSLS